MLVLLYVISQWICSDPFEYHTHSHLNLSLPSQNLVLSLVRLKTGEKQQKTSEAGKELQGYIQHRGVKGREKGGKREKIEEWKVWSS